jgi:hypothetical protein
MDPKTVPKAMARGRRTVRIARSTDTVARGILKRERGVNGFDGG